MRSLIISWVRWNTVLFALKRKHWTSLISRATPLSTTPTARPRGPASSSISGSSSARTRTATTLPKTIISREYSSEWKPGDEPYYPVNDAKNGLLYAEYKKLADAEYNVIFGGRLGEYKYYDMDQVIATVLDKCRERIFLK